MNIKNFIAEYIANLIIVIGFAILTLICLVCGAYFIAGLFALINGMFMWYFPVSIVVGILIITLMITLGE